MRFKKDIVAFPLPFFYENRSGERRSLSPNKLLNVYYLKAYCDRPGGIKRISILRLVSSGWRSTAANFPEGKYSCAAEYARNSIFCSPVFCNSCTTAKALISPKSAFEPADSLLTGCVRVSDCF